MNEKGRINRWIYDDDVHAVNGVDRFPNMAARLPPKDPPQSLSPAPRNRINVNDVLEIANVRQDEVFLVRRRGLHSLWRMELA